MKRQYFILLISFILSFPLLSQDIQLSQFYAAPLYLSPSLAGASDGTRFATTYRNQWPAITQAFVSYSLSVDHFFKRERMGMGLLFIKDVAGSGGLTTTVFSGAYSYNVKINRYWFFRPGIRISGAHRKLDYNRLVFKDQLQGNLGSSESITGFNGSVYFFDASASAMIFSRSLWLGLTVDHLTLPNIGMYAYESNLPVKYSVLGGLKFEKRGKLYKTNEDFISITFLYKKQAKFDQLDIGMYWNPRPFVVGVWYRGLPTKHYAPGHPNRDALVVLGGVKVSDLYIAYSYDITLSELSGVSGGAHEIALIYEFNQHKKTPRSKRYDIVPCPKF